MKQMKADKKNNNGENNQDNKLHEETISGIHVVYFVIPQYKKILVHKRAITFPDALRGCTALQCKEPLKYF